MKQALFNIIIFFLVSVSVFAVVQDDILLLEEKILIDTGINDPNELLEKITETEKAIVEVKTDKEMNLLLLKLGIYSHNMALYGYKKGYQGYGEKAVEVLMKLYEDQKFSGGYKAIAIPYLGSSKAIMGEQTANPIDKIRFVQEGVKYLDEAVKRYKNISYFPMFMRANVFIALPDFFKKEKIALDDYISLEAWYKKEPQRIPEGIMSVVFYNLGNYYKKQKKVSKALDYWEKAYNLDKEGETGAEAKEMMEIFGG